MALASRPSDAAIRMKIMAAVGEERSRQDEKWGEQNHSDPVWMTILTEEVGETAQAILDKPQKEVAAELLQVIAVGVAWLEAMGRRA